MSLNKVYPCTRVNLVCGYYGRLWQWDKIRNNQKWIVQFVSTDDSYISIEEARHIHKELKTEYHEQNDQGHYGSDVSEKLEFPELVKIITKKLKHD